ncbi:hypothetical protein CAEBREN_09220 [Caenorhabditis brenneri]|uniref:Uncharacterized protein n=1 Tax=Caenorhabditis brenneri TaxID=135651 RepID=G0P7J7_CAEBE|nr:hypothetical protein CAEBREN_09220 [Caenorhabditis brenneri]
MVSALLLFLTLPVVFSADPKCPEGFHYFKRVPTAWNNYTKEWCLGVIDGKEDCSNRDFARSICINHNATISMPENKHEFEFVANVSGPGATKMNHAIDGQMSPRCVNKYFKHHYFFSEEKGECNLKRGLFLFDDINTDPSYVLDHAQDHPTGQSQHQVNKTTALMEKKTVEIVTSLDQSASTTMLQLVCRKINLNSNLLPLFLFDDINTDPSFILDNSQGSPNHVDAHQVNETTSLVKYISSCLTIMGEQIQTEFCFGQQMNEYNSKAADIRTVVCGRPPL